MTLQLTTRIAQGGLPIGDLPRPVVREGGAVRIGRASDADLVLADPSSTVSSQHCTIALTPQGWAIADTSVNGTSINGTRVAGRQPLRDGDVVRIGPYELIVALTHDGKRESTGVALDDWGRAPSAGSTQHAAQQMAQQSSFQETPQQPPVANTSSLAGSSDAVGTLLASAGIRRNAVAAADPAVLAAAGALLRQAVIGATAAAAARAKARHELGVATEPSSTNPIKRAGIVEKTLADLLAAPPAAASGALAEVQAEIEAHQRATLAAMQAALRATLDTFAPAAIKARTGGNPAASWKAYQEAFDARDGFVDLFAAELGKAYAAAFAKSPDAKA